MQSRQAGRSDAPSNGSAASGTTPLRPGIPSVGARWPAAGARIRACLAFAALYALAAGADTAAPRALPGGEPVRAEVEIEGFEKDFHFTPFVEGCEAEAQVWQAGEDPQVGTRCAGLSLNVRIGQGNVALRCDLPLPGMVESIHVWVRGDASRAALAARVQDAGGETHTIPLGSLDFAGWRRLAGRLQHARDPVGGDGNGRIDFPVRLTHLCVEDVGAGHASVIYFDALAVTTTLDPDEQVSVALGPAGGIPVFEVGKPVEVALRARSLLSEPATLNYNWQLADGQGEKLASGTGHFQVTAGGNSEQKISLPAKRVGLYTVSAAALRPGGPSCRSRLLLAVVPPALNREAVQLSPLGLNIPGPLSEAERALVRLTGAGRVRVPMRWGDIEREHGLYAVDPALDATIRELARAGIRVIPSLRPENPIYPAGTETASGFGRLCHELARRFSGPDGFRTWEIACTTPQLDPAVLAAAAAAITESDPEAALVVEASQESGASPLPAPTGEPEEKRFAGISGLLSYSLAPMGFATVTVVPGAAAAKRGEPRPLYLATLATRGDAAPPNADPLDAAGCLARVLLGGLSDARVDALFLGALKESGSASVPTGLVTGDASPTPALLAYRTLAGTLRDARPKGRIEEAFVRGYLFEEGRDTLVALWSPPGDTVIAVGTSADKVAVTDVLGSVSEYPCREGITLIPVGPRPCYFRLPGGRLAVQPMLLLPEGAVACQAGQTAHARVRLRNPFGSFSPGTLRLVCPPGWRGRVDWPVAAKRGQVQEMRVEVTPAAEAAPGSYFLELWIDVGLGDAVRARVLFRLGADAKEAVSGAWNDRGDTHTRDDREPFARVSEHSRVGLCRA